MNQSLIHSLILKTANEYLGILGRTKMPPRIGVSLLAKILMGDSFVDPFRGALLSPILSFFQEQPSGFAIVLPDWL